MVPLPALTPLISTSTMLDDFLRSMGKWIDNASLLLLLHPLPLNDLLGSYLECAAAVRVPELGHRLREVTVNSPLVNQDVVHARVRLNAGLLRLILYKRVLKGVA